MTKKCRAEFHIRETKELKEERGLTGKAQKMLDSEVMRIMEPYMPKKDGHMIGSMEDFTQLGSGEIIVNTPYAFRRLLSARKDGLRGPDYFERMKADNMDHFILFLEKKTGGKG